MAGDPHVTVPAGTFHHLPIGLSFYAGPWSEAKLLGYGYALEQAAQARPIPRFLPSRGAG